MKLLPPVGWADLATKQDLDIRFAANRQDLDARFAAVRKDLEHLERQTSARFEHMERQADNRFDLLAARIEASEHRTTLKISEVEKRLLRAMIGMMLTTVIAVAGLAFAAAGLT